MPHISERGAALPASPIRKLTPYAEAAKARGVKVYHLNIGQPDLPTPEKAMEAIRSIDKRTLSYSMSQGTPALREEFSKYYRTFGIDLDPDEIIVTAGGSEALLATFLTCFDPGDEVIITEPGYANYLSFAEAAGLVVKAVTSKIENGFALPSAEDFKKAITPRTKAILICNPNNPTGYLYSPEELFQLRDLVKEHDLFLISDEVYREFVYTGEPYISALTLFGIEENVIVVDSVSKRYSECGIRIGMAVTKNKKVRDALTRFCQARLSPPLLGQIVAEASLDAPRDYAIHTYEEFIERRNCLIDGLNSIPGVYSPIPMGAFYTVARLPIDDSDRFCAWLLSDFSYEGQTVMLAPASGFYTDEGRGRDEVRISYTICKSELKMALKVLAEALKVYPGRRE